MVLPLVDEHKPKCYFCGKGFENLDELREHQKTKHGNYLPEKQSSRSEPAPGDVVMF